MVLLNVLPFGIFLILYARLLDSYAANDWAWFFCLVAAAFGTYLLPFTQTLNNHTVAAFSAFFALYQLFGIWSHEEQPGGWRFAAAGFFAAFAVANELPALAFLAILFVLLLVAFPRQTLLYFVPGALIPIAAFMAAQYAVFGEFKLAYEAFGTDEYLFEGSLWKTPLDLDAFNEHPEPYATYFFHMTLGHHGVFSLTPIFLFSALGAARLLGNGRWFPLPSARGLTHGGHRVADDSADGRTPGVLHLEPEGAELWRVDSRTALALLADPVLAASAAQGCRMGPDPKLVSLVCTFCAGNLRDVGRLCHAKPLESSVDFGRTRASESLHADTLASQVESSPHDDREGLRARPMNKPFADRVDAGRKLAERLSAYSGRNDVIVLGLPRGGVPVAFEVARALGAPLDIFLVRKLGAPGHEELAMGAIASGGIVVVHDDVVKALKISSDVLLDEVEAQRKELTRREAIYRGDRPPLDVRGKTVILIDDGMATGSSMRAAVAALRRKDPARIVVAVPVGAASTCAELLTDRRRMRVRACPRKLPRGWTLVRRLCPDARRRGLFHLEPCGARRRAR